MSIWDELIDESRKLEQTASQIQIGENIGLTRDKIEAFSRDYYLWYGTCLSVLPEDLRSDFRSEYDGNFFTPKIKKFLDAPTKPDRWRPNDKGGRKIWSRWAYPYEKTFSPYIRSQSSLLVKASKRPKTSGIVSKVDKGKEELSPEALPPQNAPRRHTRKRWGRVLFFSIAFILIFIISYILNLPVAGIILGAATILAAIFAIFGPLQVDDNDSPKSLKELFLHFAWQNTKTKLFTIVGASILILALVVALFHPFCLPDPNSTPQGTLSSFYNALVQGDYQRAYNELSSGVKHIINESDWAKQSVNEYRGASS